MKIVDIQAFHRVSLPVCNDHIHTHAAHRLQQDKARVLGGALLRRLLSSQHSSRGKSTKKGHNRGANAQHRGCPLNNLSLFAKR